MKRFLSQAMNVDHRGCFWTALDQPWAEVNYVETLANKVRGNHYHQYTYELFFIISGEIEISIESLQSGERTTFLATKGEQILIEPYELHTFRTKTNAQWIAMLSQKIDPHNPDFHRLPSAAPAHQEGDIDAGLPSLVPTQPLSLLDN